MSIFRSFNISMIPGKPPLIIHVSQYESDFVYTFHLVSGKSVLAIPDTAIAVIRGTKRDGNGYSVEAALDAENHKVVVMGDPQLTACAGRNVFELAIVNNEKVICTANFFLDVERAPLDSDTIQSETVLHDLQAIIDSAAIATQAAEEASASAESAASTAEQAVEEKFEEGVAETIDEWLTNHPEATTTVQDGSITEAKLATALKPKVLKDYVTPQMFGAKADGTTDDSTAFSQAVASGKTVLIPIGIYRLHETIEMAHQSTIVGEDQFKSILKFDSGVNGVQIQHSTQLENLTINFSDDSAGIYMYLPDNANYNLCSVCENIVLVHETNTNDGNGILLVAESGGTVEGAYNLTFHNINMKGIVKNGIHLTANAKQASRYADTWMTDILFQDILIDKSETAILSDWTDISGSSAVPETGLAPTFGAIKFINVSAQHNAGLSERFCKIMNIYDCSFTNCTPFDYYYLIPQNKPVYVFNATDSMCLIDMGFMIEIVDVTRWIGFINGTSETFNADVSKVIRFLGTVGHGNRIIGNFYCPVETKTGTDAMTLSADGASFVVDPTLQICGNVATINADIRLTGLSAGNNLIGKIKASLDTTRYEIAFYGTAAETGTPIRLYINQSGEIYAIVTSAISDLAVLRFSFTFIRKYYLYV